ncbi:MAG: PEP-CTERM sorting domain-containing protein [Fimbriimonadales bacterium]
MNKIVITALAAVLVAGANAQFLMDQIGPDNSGTGTSVFASQEFEATFPTFHIGAIDDFTVGGAANITGVEAAMGLFGGTNPPRAWANVLSFRVEVYSSVNAAAANLVGDVASTSVAAGSVNINEAWVGGVNQIALITISGLNLNIGSGGTYWLGVIPRMDFSNNQGQTGMVNSTWAGNNPGNDNAFQVNPGGGFAFPGNQQQIAGNIDLAYRVTGTVVPEPGTFIAIGIGLAGLAVVRRRK